MVKLGSPFLNSLHRSKDGGKDFRFFKGFTYYAIFQTSQESSQLSLDSIQKAYREIPEQGEICFQAGHALLVRDKALEAVKPLEDAVRIYPFPDARVDLAVALNGSGRHQEALDRLLVLDQSFPKLRRIRFELANCFVSLKRSSEALPILEDLAQIDPKDIGVQKELAYVLTELQRPKEAVPHLLIPASLAPNDPSPWIEMAYAQLVAGQIEEADKSISEAKRRKASPDIIKVMELNLQNARTHK